MRALGYQLAELRRHAHELIVVHPHHVVGAHLGRDGVGEALVHPLVGRPGPRLEGHAVDEGMEEGPYDPVAVRLVVVAHLGARERNGDAAAARPFVAGRRRVAVLVVQPRPAEPEARPGIVDRMQPRREASRAGLEREPTTLSLRRDGESIRDEQQTGHFPSALRVVNDGAAAPVRNH